MPGLPGDVDGDVRGGKVNVCRPATARQPLAASGAGKVGLELFGQGHLEMGDLRRSHFQQGIEYINGSV